MEFDTLKDMAKTVNSYRIKNIEVLGNPKSNKKIKTEIFFDALLTDKFKTEREAVRYFFKTYDTRHPGYIKLKNRLVEQLGNTALFLDTNKPIYNERAKAYYTSYKDFSVAVMLITNNAIPAALQILETLIKQTIKYEFNDLTADIARLIRCEYARGVANIDKAIQYSEIHRKYEEKRRYDMLALDYHETLIMYFMNKRTPNEEVYKLASAYFDELMPLAAQVDTSFFYRCIYNIGLMKFTLINDTISALKLCEEAFAKLSARENVHRSVLAGYLMQKISLVTQLRKAYDESMKKTLSLSLTYMGEGYFSWFRMYEVYFYYCTYCGRHEESLEIFNTVTKNEKINFLEGSYRDNWFLLGGYLHLLAQAGKLDPTQVIEIVGPFRYAKLFNEIEIVKKDKEGMNIPLVLLPVLYELAQEPSKRSKEIPIDALEKYRQRWLMKEMNKRSNCFFKMIIALAKDDNLSAATQRKISKEYEILKSETPEIARQNFAIEVIPYEDLWEMLIAKIYPKRNEVSTEQMNIHLASKQSQTPQRASK